MTIGQAFSQYLDSLKPEQRKKDESYVRRCVDYFREDFLVADLDGARVESFAEAAIKPSDPAAPERVAALKGWFQFLKKKDFAKANYGVNVRLKRQAGRGSTMPSVSRRHEAPVEVTAEGLEALKLEKADLEQQRIELVRAIEHARQDGDLRENAPYHAAREALAFNEDKRRQVDDTLRRAVVVDNVAAGQAAVGSTVHLTNLNDDRPVTYTLVSAREANFAEQKISVESPVGRQLLGRRTGDEVSVSTPRGDVVFRIDRIA
jgi:transcription elongation factor GreA